MSFINYAGECLPVWMGGCLPTCLHFVLTCLHAVYGEEFSQQKSYDEDHIMMTKITSYLKHSDLVCLSDVSQFQI